MGSEEVRDEINLVLRGEWEMMKPKWLCMKPNWTLHEAKRGGFTWSKKGTFTPRILVFLFRPNMTFGEKWRIFA